MKGMGENEVFVPFRCALRECATETTRTRTQTRTQTRKTGMHPRGDAFTFRNRYAWDASALKNPS